MPNTESSERFPKTGPNEPSVIVFKSLSKKTDAATVQRTKPGTADFVNREFGDLAILDLRNYSVSRIARHVKAHWFAFSPDEKYVAYTSALGFEPNTQQPIHEIALYEFDRGRSRKLVEGIQLGYGIELNWSPDSRQIAYISSGQRAKGEIVVVSVADGTTKSLAAKDLPVLAKVKGSALRCGMPRERISMLSEMTASSGESKFPLGGEPQLATFPDTGSPGS